MRHAFLLAPLLLAGLSACASTLPEDATTMPTTPEATITLTGTALYRERIALQDDALLTVRISDVSLADAPAKVIAETQIPTAGRQVPLPFSLDYNSASIDPRHRYSVSARITDPAGKLLWTTDTHVALPAAGQPVELRLVKVS